MGKFDGCILASDYDATLTNSKGFIPDEVKNAIKYYISEGGLFTVCTGRTKQGFHDYSPDIINAPVLLGNSAMAYDYEKEETVFLRCIGIEDKKVVEKIAFGFPEIGTEIYSSDFKSFVINPDERNIRHFEFQYINYEVTDCVPDEAFPCIKVMVSVGEKRCENFQEYLDSIDMGNIKYIPQHGNFIEIISNKTDKGKGLLTLAQKLNIKNNRVFSIGDGANDITMLKAAHIGFVPENGCDEAKKSGDIIVESNDRFAVADAINKIEKIIQKD